MKENTLDITDVVALSILEQLLKEEVITPEIFEKAKVMLLQI